jgi:hypothetical protein
MESSAIYVGSTEEHYVIVCDRLYFSFRERATFVADGP